MWRFIAWMQFIELKLVCLFSSLQNYVVFHWLNTVYWSEIGSTFQFFSKHVGVFIFEYSFSEINLVSWFSLFSELLLRCIFIEINLCWYKVSNPYIERLPHMEILVCDSRSTSIDRSSTYPPPQASMKWTDQCSHSQTQEKATLLLNGITFGYNWAIVHSHLSKSYIHNFNNKYFFLLFPLFYF